MPGTRGEAKPEKPAKKRAKRGARKAKAAKSPGQSRARGKPAGGAAKAPDSRARAPADQPQAPEEQATPKGKKPKPLKRATVGTEPVLADITGFQSNAWNPNVMTDEEFASLKWGTTIIAAVREERTCLAVELDPGWCDVIVERWQQETGGKARIVA